MTRSSTTHRPTTHRPTRARKPTRTKPKPPRPPRPSAPTSQSAEGFLYTPYPLRNEWDYGDAVSASQEVSRGYDTNASALDGLRRDHALNQTNSILSDGDAQMSVMVTDVSVDTALSGSTAQSQLTRDFYPRNFVQPAFTVSGVSIDQEDYSRLCEFIHSAQHKAVTNGYQNLTQLYVMGRDRQRGYDGTRSSGRAVRMDRASTLMKGRSSDPANARQGTFVNQTIRGSHQPILAKGYVATMPRVHERFQYAVVWQFSFVVAVMLSGIYSESAAFVRREKTWQDILANARADGVTTGTEELKKLNAKALKYAAQMVTEPFGDPQFRAPASPSQPATAGGGAQLVNGNPPRGTGQAWNVPASQESDDLTANSGPSAYGLPLNGYSELMNNTGLGHLPGGLEMYIAGNGRTVKAPKCDNGGGSSFQPVMGLYPAVSEALFNTRSGGEFHVTIWRVDGQPLHCLNGTPV